MNTEELEYDWDDYLYDDLYYCDPESHNVYKISEMHRQVITGALFKLRVKARRDDVDGSLLEKLYKSPLYLALIDARREAENTENINQDYHVETVKDSFKQAMREVYIKGINEQLNRPVQPMVSISESGDFPSAGDYNVYHHKDTQLDDTPEFKIETHFSNNTSSDD